MLAPWLWHSTCVQDPPPALWGRVGHPQNAGNGDTPQDPKAGPEGPTWATPLRAPGAGFGTPAWARVARTAARSQPAWHRAWDQHSSSLSSTRSWGLDIISRHQLGTLATGYATRQGENNNNGFALIFVQQQKPQLRFFFFQTVLAVFYSTLTLWEGSSTRGSRPATP